MKTVSLIITIIFLTNCANQETYTPPPIETINNEVTPEVTPTIPVVQEVPVEWEETPFYPSWGATVDTELPNIIVVGDSISIGYTGALYENLKTEYDVQHPMDNCRNSYFTRFNFERWFQDWNSEIIVWNNGIWDSTTLQWYETYGTASPREWYTTSLQDYEANLIATAIKMKATGARVLFMTTTKIPEKAAGINDIGKEVQLNEIAKRVLPPLGVEVYDLYEVSLNAPHPAAHDVHYTTNGYKILADFVTKKIKGE